MKKTNEFLWAHVRSQSVVVIFCAARTDRSFLRLQLDSVHLYSMLFLLGPVLASLRPYKLTSQQKVLRSLPRTAPRILYAYKMTLATVLSIGRLEWSSLALAPHRHSRINRSLSCVFTGHLCAEVRLLFGLVPWPSPSPGVLVLLLTLTCAH